MAVFDAVIWPPPWPALIAVLVVLGVLGLGCQAARVAHLRGGGCALDVAGGFLFATGLLAAVVQGLALTGMATPTVLRIIGAGLLVCVAGLAGPVPRGIAADIRRALAALWKNGTGLERWGLAGSGVVICALGLGALAPPTEIDTLAYHLSAPLYWLGHSGAYPTPYWLHTRLLGVGESLNLLGLALGSDCLGAVFQWSGVIVAAAALMRVAPTARDQVLALTLVAGCPLLTALTLTGKPQLLPSAATAFAVASIVVHRRTAFAHATPAAVWIILTATGFAVGSKYSFIPAGAAIVLLLLWSLRRTPLLGTAIVAGTTIFVVMVLPVYVRNYLYYGDPLSPILERVVGGADPVVITFSWYLRTFSGLHTLSGLIHLPWNLVVPHGPGTLTTVLGAGAFAVAVTSFKNRDAWPVLIAAAAVASVTAAVGQLSGRFFLEPYWWAGIVAVTAPWGVRKRVLSVLLAAQLMIAAALAVYGAGVLFPGALTTAARERVLTRFAADYSLARWVDEVLPPDAVVAIDRHSMLFLRRRALPADFCEMIASSPLAESGKRQRLLELIEKGGAQFLLVTMSPRGSCYRKFTAVLGAPVFVSPPFPDPARNPWRAGPEAAVAVYDVRPEEVRQKRP